MKRNRILFVMVAVLAMILTACATGVEPTATTVPPTVEPTDVEEVATEEVEATDEVEEVATEEGEVEATDELEVTEEEATEEVEATDAESLTTEEVELDETEEAEGTDVAMLTTEEVDMVETDEMEMTEEATEEMVMTDEMEMTEEATEEMVMTEEASAETVVDIAVANEDFSTLVELLQAAELVDVLADPDAEWTVFAPTNDAFEDVPQDVLDMLAEDTELLTRVLTYHVVEGTVTSDMLSDMMVPSMEMSAVGEDTMGSELDIQVADDGSVTVNGANVVTADIMASNGVIHVIDAVLLPPDVAAMLAGDEADMAETEEADMDMTEEMVMTEEADMAETEEMVETVDMSVTEDQEGEEEAAALTSTAVAVMTEEMVMTDEMEMTEEATEEMVMTDEMEMTEEMEATDEMVATDEAGAGGETIDLSGSITSVCLVTDLGRINDGSFNQSAYNGMVRAAEEFNLESDYIETEDQVDYAANIQTCLDTGAGAVITVGFLIADATLAAAEENPDVYFIGVDQFFTADAPDNLVGIQYREDQAGFLVGAMAALMTESGTIGGVYGEEIPPVIKFRHGYETGARYINPDIEILGVYVPSFLAPAEGAANAENMIGEGADVIFGAGGPTGSGAILRAAELGVMVIGVDQDEYFTTFGGGATPGAEFIITSAVKRVDQGVYDMLDALSEGNVGWPADNIYILEASNGGITFAPSNAAEVPEDVTAQVQELLDMLAAGELETGIDPVTGAYLDPESAPEEVDLTMEATESIEMTEEMEATEDMEMTEEADMEPTSEETPES
jgi:basic membrane protein A and related proteins